MITTIIKKVRGIFRWIINVWALTSLNRVSDSQKGSDTEFFDEGIVSAIPKKSSSEDSLSVRQNMIKKVNKLINQCQGIRQYKPVSNSVLIDSILEIQHIVREDFPDEKTREVCLELIRKIEESAMNTAAKSGNVAALDSLRQASKAWWE